MMRPLICGVTAGFLLLAAVHVHGSFAWIACAPLVLACRGRACQQALCAGVAFAVTVALVGNVPWVAAAARAYFELSWPSAVTGGAALGLGCGTVFGCTLGLLFWGAAALAGSWPLLAVPAVWVAWESLLTSLFPYYPWASLAATQAHMPAVLALARVGGQSGLSFDMAACGTAVALAATTYSRARPPAVAYVLIAVALPLLSAVFGHAQLATPMRIGDPNCSIDAIDAGIASGQLPRDTVIGRYIALSRRAVANRPSVLVWPESALPGYLETDPVLIGMVRGWTRSSATPLIAGGPHRVWTEAWRAAVLNAAYAVSVDGALRTYDKRRLVPFAEYWPRWLGHRPSWLPAQDAVGGREPGVFTIGACRLGMLICFEADDPQLARDLAERGATALMVLSNDAHLPTDAVAAEVTQARLRAVETGLPVVRVANRGTSVAFDGRGRLVQDSRGGILAVRLPLPVRGAGWRRAAVFVWCCDVASVLLVVVAGYRSVIGPRTLVPETVARS